MLLSGRRGTPDMHIMGKLRHAAQSMANMPLKKAVNKWAGDVRAKQEALRKLKEAVRGIINSKARKAYRAWADICAAVNAKKEKIKAALAGFTPEGRAKKFAFRRIAWIRKRQLAMQRAMSGYLLGVPASSI